jgi:hypothetical protein
MTAPDRLSVICIWLAWTAGIVGYPLALVLT